MGIIELLLLAVGLSMDAFAVSVCKGLAMEKVVFRKAAVCGIWFGSFQALMPLIGYLVGMSFISYIISIDHWVAFGLLAVIGANMIRESFAKDDNEEYNDSLGIKNMFFMAVATSIDALAVGVTFACVPVNVAGSIGETANTCVAVVIIGIITFTLSCIGVKLGSIFGTIYKKRAELAGGIVLILLGSKILIEHLVKSI